MDQERFLLNEMVPKTTFSEPFWKLETETLSSRCDSENRGSNVRMNMEFRDHMAVLEPHFDYRFTYNSSQQTMYVFDLFLIQRWSTISLHEMFSICRVNHRTRIHIYNESNTVPFNQRTILINETIFSEAAIDWGIGLNSTKYSHDYRNRWRFHSAIHPSTEKSYE